MDLVTEYSITGAVQVHMMPDAWSILKELDRLLALPNRRKGVYVFPAEKDRLGVTFAFCATLPESAVREVEAYLNQLSQLVVDGCKVIISRDGQEEKRYLGTDKAVRALRSREALAIILQELPNLQPQALEELKCEL